MKLVKPKVFNSGDKKEVEKESKIENVNFTVFKFNNKQKPKDKSQIQIIGCFSEFGCEIVGTMYCIPRILEQTKAKYVIAVGWHGREYLYRHLVDEFWEIKPEHMWVKNYCKAFHNESINLKKIEQQLKDYGSVIASNSLGYFVIANTCNVCKHVWTETGDVEKCAKCASYNINTCLFSKDLKKYKEKAVRIPTPNLDMLEKAKTYLGVNPVGIFARGRKTYGRNLEPEFYVKLIALLLKIGYTPIWLGEEASTIPCPVDGVIDFSRAEESRNLELTLAIISQLKFTIQFWTASTRLASMVGTPYLLFESPDQIYGKGQEGYRRALCDFGPSKLSINHFLNVYNDHDKTLEIVELCIKEMQEGNYNDHIGLVDEGLVVKKMQFDGKKSF